MWIALWIAYFVGIDIRPLKWPTAFYGGILILVAAVLSVVVLVLQISVWLRPRSKVN
jgi:disulfide bond formation protein DsbB